MTNHYESEPTDRDPDPHRPPMDPLCPNRFRCLCGAVAGREGLCRKCRARALFAHRDQGRRRAGARATRPSTRTDGRRPQRRRPEQ